MKDKMSDIEKEDEAEKSMKQAFTFFNDRAYTSAFYSSEMACVYYKQLLDKKSKAYNKLKEDNAELHIECKRLVKDQIYNLELYNTANDKYNKLKEDIDTAKEEIDVEVETLNSLLGGACKRIFRQKLKQILNKIDKE